MKIVLYVNSFLPTVGGKEIVVHYLARELQKLGQRVRVVGPSGWIKRRKYRPGYPVHRWPSLRGLAAEQVMSWQLALDTILFGCDIIHAHTTYPNSYIAARFKRRRPALVVTPHGYDIHMIPEIGFGHRLDPLKAKKIRFALQAAEAVTAISDSVTASLIDAGCPPAKIRKIPNGIDWERFNPQRPPRDTVDVRQWLDLEPDSLIILSVGNYHPRKGLDILLAAMQRVAMQVPQARLVLVGRGHEPLAGLVRTLNLETHVRLAGPIPFPMPDIRSNGGPAGGDRLAGLYSQSQLYVSAGISQEAEGLSLATLDAMAAGLPVVATRISGSREVVVDGATGRLVRPGDEMDLAAAIIGVLQLQNSGAEMGRQGRHAVEKYNWSEIAARYLQVYREAAGMRPKWRLAT